MRCGMDGALDVGRVVTERAGVDCAAGVPFSLIDRLLTELGG
jgi:hypothetical protein